MFKCGIPLIISIAIVISACGGGSSSPGTAATNVTIPFVARANSTVIDCDAQLTGLSQDSASGKIKSFAFYVHNVVLINADGTELPLTLDSNDWQNGEVALLDFQEKTDSCGSSVAKPTNSNISGTIAGSLDNISKIRFTIGVPSSLNHKNASAAATPLNRTDLFWSWQTGYKHMRLDVAPTGGVTKPDNTVNATWNFHLGSTGCTGDAEQGETVSCTSVNHPIIELDVADFSNSKIVLDYAKLVENNNLLTDGGGAPGCMSGATDPECDEVFDALGMGISGNADPNPGQTVFSVE